MSDSLIRSSDPHAPPPLTIWPPYTALMPSIDLYSTLTPRRGDSAYSTPLLELWDMSYKPLPPPTIYTTPSTPKSHHRQCTPYGSPSNPFTSRPNVYLSPSDIHSRQTVNLHRAIQRITGISPSNGPRSVGWKEHIETDWTPVGQTVLRVVFWAAIVVYFSALFGVGAPGDQGGMTTRAWNQHIAEPSGMSRMGWKGVGMIDRVEEMKRVGEMGKGLQGIWDTE